MLRKADQDGGRGSSKDADRHGCVRVQLLFTAHFKTFQYLLAGTLDVCFFHVQCCRKVHDFQNAVNRSRKWLFFADAHSRNRKFRNQTGLQDCG